MINTTIDPEICAQPKLEGIRALDSRESQIANPVVDTRAVS